MIRMVLLIAIVCCGVARVAFPQDSPMIEDAKHLVRDHYDYLLTISSKHLDLSKPTAEENTKLQTMAQQEGNFYVKLTPAERREVYHYAMSLFESHATRNDMLLAGPTPRERYLKLMEKLGIPTVRADVKDSSFENTRSCGASPNNVKAVSQDLLEVQGHVFKCAYCIGFIIGNRRCCANNVGNGVCGGAPTDCFHQSEMESESCPPNGDCWVHP